MRKKAFLCLVFSALLIWGALLPALADEEVTLTILDTEEAQIPEAAETAEPAETQPPVGNASAGGDPAAQQCGWLADRYGLSWQVIPRDWERLMNAPDRAASQRAMQALMKMKKLDIAALQAAFDGR